jgi:hypothetical protein
MQAAKADKTVAVDGVGLAKMLCCHAQPLGPVRHAVSKL